MSALNFIILTGLVIFRLKLFLHTFKLEKELRKSS